MTLEEIQDNYEFKVCKKLVLNKFPFIKDVIPQWHDLDKYSLLFVTLVMDGNKLQEYFKHPADKWTIREVNRGEDSWSPYLTTFLEGRDTLADKRAKAVDAELDTLFHKVHTSVAMPTELRLLRKLSTGRYVISPKVTGKMLTWEGGQLVDNSPL
mgnify:CR=1 FL=1